LARIEPPERATADLRSLLDSTRELLEPLAQKRSIELVTAGPERALALVDAGQIRQVLMNLVMNAIDAMRAPGKVWLRVAPEDAEGGGEAGAWVLEVEDQGAGIAPEHLSEIFEPFFTTKPVGEGTGLGLSIVAGIVREHGGTIQVASAPGEGTTFRVRLPRGAAAAAGPTSEPEEAET